MSAPSKIQKQARRLGQKGLRQQLCERFENSYGYDKGRTIIPTIVDDILALVEEYYGPQRGQQPNQIVYSAAHQAARLTARKTMAQTRQQAICLTIIAPGDAELYAQGRSVLRRARLLRWLQEAKAQGALLSSADLAFLSSLSCATVDHELRLIEKETGALLPLRGTVHDASSKLTHKAKIVELYRQGRLPTEIARLTDHSLEAVEHYLRHFELVRELWPGHGVEQIAHLMQCGPRLVQQYVALLQEQEERDTPVRGPSLSLLSGSHEPAGETIAPS
jgi:hypothetical protein